MMAQDLSPPSVDALQVLRLSPPPSISVLSSDCPDSTDACFTPCDTENIDPQSFVDGLAHRDDEDDDAAAAVADHGDDADCDNDVSASDNDSDETTTRTIEIEIENGDDHHDQRLRVKKDRRIRTAFELENTPSTIHRFLSDSLPHSNHSNHHHHHHHRHHHEGYLHVTIDDEEDATIHSHHHTLPLSPSMTPPIVLSPPQASSPSPRSPSSPASDEPIIDSEVIIIEDDNNDNTSDSRLLTTASDERRQSFSQTIMTSSSASPSLPPIAFNRSIHIRRSQRRYSPYAGVLRPINALDDNHHHQQTNSPDSRLRNESITCDNSSVTIPSAGAAMIDSVTTFADITKVDDGFQTVTIIDDDPVVDVTEILTTTTTTTLTQTIESDNLDDVDDNCSTNKASSNSKNIRSNNDCSNNKRHNSNSGGGIPFLHQQLHIDTQLANSQCAAAQCETRAAKMAIAHQLLSVIRNGDFDRFIAILRQSKPDLNVFVDGQTALHYCLMQRRDVSWCKQLVLYGANPNLASQDGWHPLHLAAHHGLIDNLTYLISCNSHRNHRHHHHHQQQPHETNGAEQQVHL